MNSLILATERYTEQKYIHSNPTEHIEQSTSEYLYAAFSLYECKHTLNRKQYRALLEEYGWDKGTTEERRSLKIAENFQAFVGCPEHLAVLPVPILLRLCSKNYQVLIEKLQDIPIGRLTCKLVLELIKERAKFLKSQRKEKKVGNWRATPDGNRYYTFGKIMEDDHQTGVLADKLIEQLGFSPQRIVRMAIADFYQKLTDVEEPLEVVENTTSDVSDVNDSSTQEINQNPQQETTPTGSSQTVEERWEELAQQLITDIQNIGRISDSSGRLIVECCQRWEATVPQDKRWDAVSNILRHDTISLKHLSNYAYNHNPQWRETWGANLANYHSFEQELAWVDTDVRNDALVSMGFDIPATVEIKTGNRSYQQGKVMGLNGENITPILVKVDGFNHYFHWTELEVVKETSRFKYYKNAEQSQEEYLEEPQESDLELEPTPLDKGIDVLIQGDWEDIISIFNQYPEVKVEAWNALSNEQKRRVIGITPDSVKVLNGAKKEGVIEEYKEIANGVYEIKLPGTLIWENRAFHEIEIYHQLRKWRENVSCSTK
ncbi:MAG: hypothetical protein WBA41_21075 [Rivularia sp. (in: cyanobacteria)]